MGYFGWLRGYLGILLLCNKVFYTQIRVAMLVATF